MAKVLELQLQHQSFQWLSKVDFLLDWLVWSPCSPRGSQESSSGPQFERIWWDIKEESVDKVVTSYVRHFKGLGFYSKMEARDFPGGPVVESLPANAAFMGSMSGPGRFHTLRGSWAHQLQWLKPMHLEPMFYNKRNCCDAKPVHCN